MQPDRLSDQLSLLADAFHEEIEGKSDIVLDADQITNLVSHFRRMCALAWMMEGRSSEAVPGHNPALVIDLAPFLRHRQSAPIGGGDAA
jgi:hypothetical protein